jgi:hypothetical protein
MRTNPLTSTALGCWQPSSNQAGVTGVDNRAACFTSKADTIRLRAMAIDRAALAAGTIRLASGISFLVDPIRANQLWGADAEESSPTARLLLRSMGYRDALIGGLLATAALRGKNTRGWFLASAGADASDLLGGMSVHDEMKRSQVVIGLGGAVVGIAVGLWGAVRRAPGTSEAPLRQGPD